MSLDTVSRARENILEIEAARTLPDAARSEPSPRSVRSASVERGTCGKLEWS